MSDSSSMCFAQSAGRHCEAKTAGFQSRMPCQEPDKEGRYFTPGRFATSSGAFSARSEAVTLGRGAGLMR